MKDYYLYTENLSVGFGKKKILENIGIQLKKGQITVLIGPNGAGKSTILKNFTKQLQPLSGSIYLDQKEIQKYSAKELAKKMSMVMTNRIHPELITCEEVVEMGRYPYTGQFGFLRENEENLIREAMKIVHIEELAEQEFDKISDGQKQRVLLAKAICQNPELMILDEPTSYLDIKYKLELVTILKELVQKKNMVILLSIHELELAKRIADQVICIKNGVIDRIGEPEKIFTEKYIRSLYDMEDTIQMPENWFD